MVQINVTRIDDRLIHGQIVTAWIAESEANVIIVADDKASEDSFTQSLLEMATPSNLELRIFSLKDAVHHINDPESKGNALLIVKNPIFLLEMVQMGLPCTDVNVGNMGMKPGKRQLAQILWTDESEISAFKDLAEKGVRLEMRAVPRDKSVDVKTLL